MPAATPSPAPALRDVPVLVTGADGFVGRWVTRALSGAGARVAAAVLSAAAARPVLAAWAAGPVELLEADLRREQELAGLVARVRPAVTFNLAGYGVGREERDPELAQALNAELVERLAEACRRHRDPAWPGMALVHVGSALEYGEVGGSLAEDGPTRPTTLYGRTKLAGTEALAKACEASGLPGLTARLFMVYGPGERPGRLLPTLLEAARDGTEVALSAGRQRRDFTFVEDAAEGLVRLAAATVEPGRVLNLATGRLTSVRDFALAAARVLDLPPERLRFGEVPVRPEEMAHEPVDVARLVAALGWKPERGPEDGVRAALRFLAEQEART